MRLLFISDFTEQFAYRLLRGILAFSRRSEQPWVVCKMPPSHKKKVGIRGVIRWAKKWKADVVIGQFEPGEDVSLFRKNGIVAIAQDHIRKFNCIPNITADYEHTGAMVAKRLCGHGFKNFGFLGHKDLCWSDGRLKGFRDALKEMFQTDKVHVFNNSQLSSIWDYDWLWP